MHSFLVVYKKGHKEHYINSNLIKEVLEPNPIKRRKDLIKIESRMGQGHVAGALKMKSDFLIELEIDM